MRLRSVKSAALAISVSLATGFAPRLAPQADLAPLPSHSGVSRDAGPVDTADRFAPRSGAREPTSPYPFLSAIAVVPTSPSPTIYVGTWGHGIYQSRDRGTSWRAVDDGLGQITSIAVYPDDPRTILAGTANLGVLQITEDGGSYHYLSRGIAIQDVRSVAVGSLPAAALYAGTAQGVYRTLDNGNTWTLIGLETDEVDSLAIDRANSDVVVVGTKVNGVWFTTDGGASWMSLRSQGPAVSGLLLDPALEDILYAATDGAGVKRVFLGGALTSDEAPGDHEPSQAPLEAEKPAHLAKSPPSASRLPGPYGGTVIDLKMDPRTPTTLYAASNAGVFKTTDNGETWHPTGLMSKSVFSLTIDPNNPLLVYAGTDGEGLYRSTDGGLTWEASGDQLMQGKVIYTLAVDPSDPQIIYAGGRTRYQDGTTSGDWGGGVFKSTDGGLDWQAMNNGLPEGWVYTIVVDPAVPGTLYAGTHSMGVFRSTDGGASWESKSRGLVSDDHLVSDNMKVRSLAINPHDHNNLVVGVWGGDGVLETETAGETWHVAGSRALRDRVRVVTFDSGERPQIFAGRAAGGAMVCANQDPEAAWRSFPDQALGGWDDFSIVSAIAVNPSDGRTIFLGVYGAGVLRSTDGGLTWKEVDVGLSVTSVTAVVPVPSLPGTLYASTNGSGIFKSTDGGATWSLHAWASPGDWALGLALDPSDPNVLYVVTQTHGLVSLPIDPGAASLCASATCGN